MKDSILCVQNLAKNYGRVEAVRDVSFSIRRNAITVFLGENGAGKTTTLKAILGFLKPDRGSVELRAKRLGYIPEHPVFFPWLKGWEILRSTMRVFERRVEEHEFISCVEKMSDKIRFDPGLLERKVQTYSLGNQKKFSYLQSLIISPELLIVDEPLSSLDPLSIKSMRDLFGELKAAGHTLFLSSHLISEMEKIADDVIIIKQGRILLEGSVGRLKKDASFDLEALFLSFHSKQQG